MAKLVSFCIDDKAFNTEFTRTLCQVPYRIYKSYTYVE